MHLRLRVTPGKCIYMFFRSEVVVTRFNRRKERVNTMSWITHLQLALLYIICYRNHI